MRLAWVRVGSNGDPPNSCLTNEGNGDNVMNVHDKVILASRVHEAVDGTRVHPDALCTTAQVTW